MKHEARNMKGLGGIFLLFASCILLLSACGSDNATMAGEDYGNISTGVSGAVIVESEHSSGWGKSDCFECHNMGNIHQTDRSGTGLNLGAIRTLTEEQGLTSCSTCNGTNGVQ